MAVEAKPSWNERYATKDTPWDSGRPSAELQRVLEEHRIRPADALELGCGTGTNAVFLAQRGFRVTALDISPLAIEQAKKKSQDAEVSVHFMNADLLSLPDLGRTFGFVFDRGVYHCVREDGLDKFLQTLAAVTSPGSQYLVLAGNANDPAPPDRGPPRVRADQLCAELGGLFDLVQLREFHFDGVVIEGEPVKPLGWSALLRRKSQG
jgi:SAM-dependent methyltransferase